MKAFGARSRADPPFGVDRASVAAPVASVPIEYSVRSYLRFEDLRWEVTGKHFWRLPAEVT